MGVKIHKGSVLSTVDTPLMSAPTIAPSPAQPLLERLDSTAAAMGIPSEIQLLTERLEMVKMEKACLLSSLVQATAVSVYKSCAELDFNARIAIASQEQRRTPF